jgi:hypothetical protein
VQQRLNVPVEVEGKAEAPTAFWSRMERAGVLPEAIGLYDQLAVEQRSRSQTRRETKLEFDQRIKNEGREGEAERLRGDLAAQGLSGRELQDRLVEALQPVSGDATRAWQTPNPWNAGRLFRKKADQDRLLALKGSLPTKEDLDRNRLRCAQHRLAERQALLAARQRVQALKAAPVKVKAAAKPTDSASDESNFCERCCRRGGIHYRGCRRFIDGKTSLPCEDCLNGVVTPSNPTYHWERRNLCDSCYRKGRQLGWI